MKPFRTPSCQFLRAFLLALLLAAMVLCQASGLALAQSIGENPPATKPAPPPSETGRYMVYFTGDSALDSTKANKGQIQSASVRSAVAGVRAAQIRSLKDIERLLGRKVKDHGLFDLILNAASLEISSEEAALVQALPKVVRVLPVRRMKLATDAGPAWVGAPQVWSDPALVNTGANPPQYQSMGEGVLIGVLDTGINFDHPSFASDPAISGDTSGYVYPIRDTYLGVCDGTIPLFANACNDKLIGAYSMTGELDPSSVRSSPEDAHGHGSHVASIAAGNQRIPFDNWALDKGVTYYMNGMAPHAQLIAYDVCVGDTCMEDHVIQGIEQAIQDGVDVINFSISGYENPYDSSIENNVEFAFLAAFKAGIFVSAAAGNFDSRYDTTRVGMVNHLAPWMTTVGASTHDRSFGKAITVTSPTGSQWQLVEFLDSAPVPFASSLAFSALWAGLDTSSGSANTQGCLDFPAAYFSGKIAIIKRGGCTFAEKYAKANAAQALGIFVYTNEENPVYMDGLYSAEIPAAMLWLTPAEAIAFEAFLRDDALGNLTLQIRTKAPLHDPAFADLIWDSSYLGPSGAAYGIDLEIMKPDLVAPGVKIFAAGADYTVDKDPYAESAEMTGTSMATPHVAGAAALLMSAHPDWSVSEVKSALMLTAETRNLAKADFVTPADPFDYGAGRLKVDAALKTGLVMDETADKMTAADPALPTLGDPKQLNMPSMQSNACSRSCSFVRKFRSVAASTVTYTVTVPAWLSVSPAKFTISPGGVQTLTIIADMTKISQEGWNLGEVQLTPSDTSLPALHLTAVINGFGPYYLFAPIMAKDGFLNN